VRRRRRRRFAGVKPDRRKPSPPAFLQCRAERSPPFTVTGRPPVRRHRLGLSRPPLSLRRRYSPLRFRPSRPTVSSSLKSPRPPLFSPNSIELLGA
jgi:hypothetical protein